MDNFQDILININRYVRLSNDDKRAFIDIIETKQLSKKQLIIKPDQVCQHQTYIHSGSASSYFVTKDGVEHTIQFAIEDWFISDFNSYISQSPATLFIEVLENSIIYQLAYHKVEQLCLEHPIFERFFRLVAQKSFAYSQKRVLSNLGQNAQERFTEFNTLYPKIVSRVPQYMLASYLGITPEFLSKIRKKLI